MKINKIINLASLFLMVSVSAGCDKFLDTSLDTNRKSENIETDRSNVWYFGYAFYSPISGGFSRIDDNLFATASDEAQQTSVSSDVVYFNKGIVNENVNPLSYLYNDYYEGIRAANFFLDYVKDGKGVELLTQNRDIVTDKISYERDLQSLDWMIAEAHVAKAYYYGELIKMYGGVPVIEYDAEAPVARSSYDECVDYIVSEIDTYKDRLAVDWKDFADRGGRFTLGAALAIKARVLLYAASPLHNPSGDMEKWKKAADASAEIISNKELGYVLSSDYQNYFLGNNCLSDKETIYAVRMANSNTLEAANYPIATAGGKSGACPTENLVSQYEYIGPVNASNPYSNRDPRLDATIVHNGSEWNGRTIDLTAGGSDDMAAKNATRTGYYLKKFLNDGLNLTQGATAQHNWVAYRYAEVLLNYAEAMNEVYGPMAKPEGYPMSATDALMMVRNRASAQLPRLAATTKAAFRAAVKHERQIELAFEDHRYWDLIRWMDAKDVLNRPVKGVKIAGGAYEVVDVAARSFEERNYYLPFTRSEIQNSNGTLEQNKGY